MKTRKQPLRFILLPALLCLHACQDWGETDPPAGNQIYPHLEQVAELNFNEELIPQDVQAFAFDGGKVPTLVQDDTRGQVLRMERGYARLFNPLNAVKVQNGVSLTLWVKTDAPPAGEGQDLTSALFSFRNENHTQRLFFTANGWLRYEGVDGTYEDNNPETGRTGLMTDGEWHYLAIAVTKTGYFVYVDGLKKIEKEITAFDFAKIVRFMASVPYIYIGDGGDTRLSGLSVDDVRIFRNTITDKQTALPSSGSGEEETDTDSYFTIGADDFSTGFWSAFTDVLSAEGDCEFRYRFYNYTNGANNWNNYIVVLTNGKAFGQTGYKEYLVLRADAFGWGDYWTAANMQSTFDWNTYKTDMQGAFVDLSVRRTGTRIDIKATITKADGNVMESTYHYEGATTETLGTFLTLENAYLKISKTRTSVGKSFLEGSYRVGESDFSSGWWTAFSGYSKIGGNGAFQYLFRNRSNKLNNWNNWVLILTNNKERGAAGYVEYMALRADAFGWGDYYKAENLSHDFNFETFREDMDKSLVNLIVKRKNDRLDITATITKADGSTMHQTYFYDGFPAGGDLGMFLTVEGGYLDILSEAILPFIDQP